MWASGNILEADARKAAMDAADGKNRYALSPKELKRRLALKKAKARIAKVAGQAGEVIAAVNRAGIPVTKIDTLKRAQKAKAAK